MLLFSNIKIAPNKQPYVFICILQKYVVHSIVHHYLPFVNIFRTIIHNILTFTFLQML